MLPIMRCGGKGSLQSGLGAVVLALPCVSVAEAGFVCAHKPDARTRAEPNKIRRRNICGRVYGGGCACLLVTEVVTEVVKQNAAALPIIRYAGYASRHHPARCSPCPRAAACPWHGHSLLNRLPAVDPIGWFRLG